MGNVKYRGRLDRDKKEKIMKLEIDWAGLAKAVIKAIWPFLAGALGGFTTGCSFCGSGVGLTL